MNDLKITIGLGTAPVAQAGFGLPLIVGKRTSPDTLIGEYSEFSSLPEMVDAGFETTDVEYKMAAAMFGQSPRVDKIAVYIYNDSETLEEALANLAGAHNDWYALLIASNEDSDLTSAANFVAANNKIFIGRSSSISTLTDRNNIREMIWLHDDETLFPDAAMAGLCLPKKIGAYTWKWQKPNGIGSAGWSTTELGQIEDNNGNTLIERYGIVASTNGITTGGEFIDIIMSRDWVDARLKEALYGLFVREDKVGFDFIGLSQIEHTMREVFNAAGKQGIIANCDSSSEEDMSYSDDGKYLYNLNIPERGDIPTNDRAERKVSGIEFNFIIGGAVHAVEISGRIEV